MKKIMSLVLMLASVFGMVACAVVPVYDSADLVAILKENGYTVEEKFTEDQNGITGYYYAHKNDKSDELYYIYCEDFKSSKSIYDYISSRQKARVASLKMDIEQIEFALYKSEGVSAEEKGKYYQRYVEQTEKLEFVENYTCGRGLNVVWYGTKKAVLDIKGITDKLGR